MEAIAEFLLGVIGNLITTILGGWIFVKLWLWFLVIPFGAPPLRIPVAIGIAIMVMLLTGDIPLKADVDQAGKGKVWRFVYRMLVLVFGLGAGYITHLFV